MRLCDTEHGRLVLAELERVHAERVAADMLRNATIAALLRARGKPALRLVRVKGESL
jgi:hypothetical protein